MIDKKPDNSFAPKQEQPITFFQKKNIKTGCPCFGHELVRTTAEVKKLNDRLLSFSATFPFSYIHFIYILLYISFVIIVINLKNKII
jgi:hypothetical protein